MSHDYRFRSTWTTPHPVPEVYDVLHDIRGYVGWWPQIRSIEEIDERSGRARCRSFLPYSLRLVLRATVEDPDRGVLEVDVDGDLDGWCRWRMVPEATPGGPGTRLWFEQEVVARAPLLRRTGRLGRPVLEANHAWMMRGCRRGLDRRLSRGPGGRTPR